MFSESKQALIDLQQNLQCRKCHENSKVLLCLGQCEHWFCRSCAESSSGNLCPICCVPSVASETRVDLQLTNVVSLCSYMMQLIDGVNSSFGTESIISPEDIGNLESQDPDDNVEFGRCYLSLSNPETSTAVNATNDKGKQDVNCKVERSDQEEEAAEETSVIGKYDDTSHPQKLIQSTSGSTGKKKISAKVGIRKPYCKDHIAKLCDEGELLGKSKVKERSNKPRKSIAKIFDTFSEITPDSKKRKCENVMETPESESMIRKVERFNAKGSKRSTPHQKVSTQFTDKYSILKNTPKSSSMSDMTPKKATPHSSKKRQSADTEKSNLSKRNAKGETLLQVATIKMDFAEVGRLLEAGANPNVKDNAGWTPLHEAIGHGCTDIASLLITSGASVNAPGLDNETPLHDAVINQDVESVRLLLANGAGVYARNVHGSTPFDLAQTEEIKSLLLNASKDSFVADVDLPMLDESRKPLCFTGSNLTKAETKTFIQYIRVLQGKIVDEVTPEVTHLVTNVNEDGMCSRTMKYLSAVLTGKWIINLKGLEEFAKNKGGVVPEQKFQVSGCSSHPNSCAPKKALENRLKQLPPLFDGCQVYFYGKFELSGLSKGELATLVKLGGGVVLKREPHLHNLDDYPYTRPYHSQNTVSLADCTIYKIYDDGCCNPPSVEAQRMSCLPVSWLLDSIASFSFLEKMDYSIS